MAHFILDNAKRYDEPNTEILPEEAIYITRIGYWTDKLNHIPLINSEGFRYMSTKKEDRETGEDQKGE